MFRSMLLALVITLVTHAAQGHTPGRNAITRESTITATVDRIERSSRVVTLRSPELGTFRRPGEDGFQSVDVDPSVKTFDDLKVGDVIKVEGFRAKDGSNNGSGGNVTFADGRKVFAGSAEDVVPR